MKKGLIGLAAAMMLAFGGAAFAGKLDINGANAKELAKAITGVGEVKAEAIVSYRKEHGPFKSVDGLQAVDGIGPKTVEKNREFLTVGEKQ
ncbi:MAG TPA: helix-hairpin-helix domain-containing protein [Gammaproteobacteria bacterium]|nr:helix-hairpin-helix domain-containing protein [Gammaproteobacteria bacterium]